MVRSKVAVAVALLAATLLPACTGDDSPSGPQVEVGRNFEDGLLSGKALAGAERQLSLQLPGGRLRIGVDPSLRSIEVDDPKGGSNKVTMLPPRNGSLVRVAWQLDTSSRSVVLDGEAGLPKRGLFDDYDTIMLVAGRTKYTLDAGDNGVGHTVWSVAGDGSDVRVEVSFDGVTQSVLARTGARSVGRAAALYGQPAARTGDCGSPQYVAPFSAPAAGSALASDFTCEYQVRRVGYVAGKGWAPAGQAWLVVDLDLVQPDEVSLTRAGRREAYSFGFGDELTATLDGQAGARARGKFRGSNDGYGLYFAVPLKTTLPASLTVTHTQSVYLTADRDKRDRVRRPLVLTYDVPLR